MLHNCYLPDWIHRLANGAIGGLLASAAVCAAVSGAGASFEAFWSVPLVASICMGINPRRFSLVEGCAGDLGYDELVDDDRRDFETFDA